MWNKTCSWSFEIKFLFCVLEGGRERGREGGRGEAIKDKTVSVLVGSVDTAGVDAMNIKAKLRRGGGGGEPIFTLTNETLSIAAN